MSSIFQLKTVLKTLIIMQRNNTNSKKLNTPAYKTFCKVCQDSGKSISEYTNHNVRDRSGNTVCPTLNAQECRNCYKKGHTLKYCSLLKAAPVQPVKKAYQEPVKAKAPSRPKNVFMVFDESDSESEKEEEKKPVKQEKTEFPTLTAVNAQAPVQKKPVLNYGTIIEQVNDPEFALALAEAKAKSKALAQAKAEELALAEAEAKARDARIKATAGKKICWATAESDSEGDEDEDAYVAPKKAVQKQQIEDNSAW